MKRNTYAVLSLILLCMSLWSRATASGETRMICYSTQPNNYLTDHAKDIAKIYDGFFFSIGSWESGPVRVLGVDDQAPTDKNWQRLAKMNLPALKKAGVTENFLTVYFGQEEEWPSPASLLSNTFTQKMVKNFSAIARTAKDLGFRGVCVDIEYPYPRYSVDHPVYNYIDYTAEDLEVAAKKQGRACMQAMLAEFPQAVIIVLPGEIRSRLLGRHYLIGMLEVMAELNAPGGFHLGCEFTYSLNDPVSSLITPRFEDAAISIYVDAKTLEYWKQCCTIAPGVWPLHMVETGGKDYPVRSWKQEIAELKDQMTILRKVSKRYIWSFTSVAAWYLYSPALEKKYGLTKQTFSQPDIDLAEWHKLLMDKTTQPPAPLAPLFAQVERFDLGEITADQLCDVFGTPAHWWVLGMLANPFTKPAYSAATAPLRSIDQQQIFHGRDNALRWFDYAAMDPRGIFNCARLFDWRNINDASAHLVAFVHSEKEQQAVINVGWDDGIVLRFNDQVVFDQASYPKRGRGQQYKDRYVFEKQIPVTIKAGKNKLAVTTINSHGSWIYTLRITAADGIPLENIKFGLE